MWLTELASGSAEARRWIAAGAIALGALALSTHAPAAAAPSASPVPVLPNFDVQIDSARNTVNRIEAKSRTLSPSEPTNLGAREPAAAALEFVSRHRELFRLADPPAELKTVKVQGDDLGFQHVRFTQQFRGLDVVTTDLLFHYNREGVLYLVTANYIPTPTKTELQPKLDRAAAVRAAAAEVSATPGDWPATLKIWAAPSGAGILTYEVAASVAADKAWRVFVDAHTGRILDRISTVYTAPPPSPR